MLSLEETLDLIKKAQEGDEESKEKLITNNSPLIKSIVKLYKNKGVEYDDLYQLGCLGFIKAINNFKTEFNVKFSTYAVPMITGEIKRFLRDDGSIKVSRALKTLYMHINKFINEYKAQHCSSPTVSEIAEKFNIEESEVMFAMDSSRALLSLDEKVEESNTKSKTLMETIIGDFSDEKMIDKIVLKSIIRNLNEREREIIYLRYYLDKTQSEVAKKLNVSQVQVSRLELKILEKIKQRYRG